MPQQPIKYKLLKFIVWSYHASQRTRIEIWPCLLIGGIFNYLIVFSDWLLLSDKCVVIGCLLIDFTWHPSAWLWDSYRLLPEVFSCHFFLSSLKTSGTIFKFRLRNFPVYHCTIKDSLSYFLEKTAGRMKGTFEQLGSKGWKLWLVVD